MHNITHRIIKLEDEEKYLSVTQKRNLADIVNAIFFGRVKDNKCAYNNYYIVNKDESWAHEVEEVIRRNTGE